MSEGEDKGRLQLVAATLASLLALSLVALLVVVLLWQTGGSHGEDRAVRYAAAGKAADKAARKAVVEMTSYDYRTVRADFAWVDDAGTTKFQKQYAEVSKPIKKLVVQLKAKAKGTVVASAPVVTDADHVTVLLFVDQEISNPGTGSTGAQKGLDQPRVTMKMVRQGGRWLVDEVTISSLSDNRG